MKQGHQLASTTQAAFSHSCTFTVPFNLPTFLREPLSGGSPFAFNGQLQRWTIRLSHSVDATSRFNRKEATGMPVGGNINYRGSIIVQYFSPSSLSRLNLYMTCGIRSLYISKRRSCMLSLKCQRHGLSLHTCEHGTIKSCGVIYKSSGFVGPPAEMQQIQRNCKGIQQRCDRLGKLSTN